MTVYTRHITLQSLHCIYIPVNVVVSWRSFIVELWVATLECLFDCILSWSSVPRCIEHFFKWLAWQYFWLFSIQVHSGQWSSILTNWPTYKNFDLLKKDYCYCRSTSSIWLCIHSLGSTRLVLPLPYQRYYNTWTTCVNTAMHTSV